MLLKTKKGEKNERTSDKNQPRDLRQALPGYAHHRSLWGSISGVEEEDVFCPILGRTHDEYKQHSHPRTLGQINASFLLFNSDISLRDELQHWRF